MGGIWMESRWHILGQLSVNCPFCAKVLCGLCFTASRCSHATKAKLKANIQMRPETEIHFSPLEGGPSSSWFSSTGSRRRPAMQWAASEMTHESGDVCALPPYALRSLLNVAVREKKYADTGQFQTYIQHLLLSMYYLCTQMRAPAHACVHAM